MKTAEVITGSRLHFGPLSVAAPAGGKFGGVGLMVETPRLALTARVSTEDSVRGDPEVIARVIRFLKQIRQATPEINWPQFDVTIHESIPSHCGFGSGTQLGLAVARVTSLLTEELSPSLETLARRVGRGFRSAVGLYGFDRGGFLVDGGRAAAVQLGTLVARVDFPADWRFVLAAPRATAGLSGEAEQSAFAQQPPMPTSLTSELCRIVLMDWLPAVIDPDFDRCSSALSAFGNAVGNFFASAQGGIFADPRMADWASRIQQCGIRGVAQTSWGPTLAALCPNQSTADQLQRDFAHDAAWSDCLFQVAAPMNRGATVRHG